MYIVTTHEKDEWAIKNVYFSKLETKELVIKELTRHIKSFSPSNTVVSREISEDDISIVVISNTARSNDCEYIVNIYDADNGFSSPLFQIDYS